MCRYSFFSPHNNNASLVHYAVVVAAQEEAIPGRIALIDKNWNLRLADWSISNDDEDEAKLSWLSKETSTKWGISGMKKKNKSKKIGRASS